MFIPLVLIHVATSQGTLLLKEDCIELKIRDMIRAHYFYYLIDLNVTSQESVTEVSNDSFAYFIT